MVVQFSFEETAFNLAQSVSLDYDWQEVQEIGAITVHNKYATYL